ncbi:PSD1 and planctomycete cytochrome C domain-containing protein [Algibacillus agarilyticus]|uniref:PSD1 and planctomycete cytochrome C domain-containing protein n=1 Tax=Algibacillus agarilyticus TaxID=2234133 RepID=UPI000DCF65A7|nr:PSD1 and planctomycete cytochrome C domain-containing protein [Algibacillus agarilyticus]
MMKYQVRLFSLTSPLIWLSLVSLLIGCTEPKSESSDKKISFNNDIRPILNKSCTGCHGGVGKQSNVSFIYREEALGRGHSGRLTIVPGDPDASELIVRVESNDPNIRMPYKAPALSQHEIQLLRTWIEQGAEWEEHWAFIKPQNHSVPTVQKTERINNEIDAFLQANLEEQQLSLSESANKTTLLRRLSFDLIGLPPTEKEIDAFLADEGNNAFEKQVDRLLASPRYGERWAAMWMDLARYADSHGYTRDEYRESWPYKQWVIEALNNNKPYNEFVIEQLAGDLMPNRSLDNIIATGFHRQTPSNSEGGTDDEEFRMVAVMDRNATTWSVLNAMTINCVQCHSHPYDPIEHDEYYASLSFFNTSKDADYRDYEPLYKLAKNKTEHQLAFDIQENLIKIREQEAQKAFELNKQTEALSPDKKWQKVEIETAQGDELRGLSQYIKEMEDKNAELTAQGKKPNYRHVELVKVGKKRIAELTKQPVRHFEIKNGEYFDAGKYEARLYFNLISQAFEQTTLVNNIKLTATPQNPDKARHTPEKPFHIDDIKLYVIRANGEKTQLSINTHMSNSTEVMDEQLTQLSKLDRQHDGLSTGEGVGWFAHRIYLPRWTVAVLNQPLTLQQGDKIEVELAQMQRTMLGDGIPSRLHRARIDISADAEWLNYANSEHRTTHVKHYGELKNQLASIEGYGMPVMLEQDRWDNRAMAKFNRGNMIAKVGELLKPNTPAIFPHFTQQPSRLGLGQWFFQPDQPLTARVAVNRLWHRLFGIGIVETLEDFGSAGTSPTHPELLDWLALHFQNDLNWDMKAILKKMVMSHAYQQDATIDPTLLEKDPKNQWLSRGPRQRLTAEMIRDQALLAADLLVNKIGGEPAMPPQPDGIWGHPGKIIKEWTNATDENRYRRAIYTFVKRAFMYPSFLTFDMETREFSHERRIATNTPLQALVTLNDPVYHEAAQALGKLMQDKAASSIDSAIELGFKRVLSRQPNKNELASLNDALNEIQLQLKTELADKTEQTKQANTLSSGSWTAMASILLNLDDALTR